MTKYEKISVLAKETARSIGENKESWMNYLDVASRLYKYPFEDQILIYAQRPDATACAPLEMWNEKMFCWVNRGAKGIALIDQESDYPRLRYVFDVSDVHKARRIGKSPFIWNIREEHEEGILAALERIYGTTNQDSSFEDRIYQISKRIADDYYEEIVDDLIDVSAGSYLEDLDGDTVSLRLRETLEQSVCYTVLKRCGFDMAEYEGEFPFDYIHEFNTLRTLSVLGSATSELCEPMLIQIGRSIARYDRELARHPSHARASRKEARVIREDDFVIGLDSNTSDWFVYDNVTAKNICYCDSEEEAKEHILWMVTHNQFYKNERMEKRMNLTYEKNGDYRIPNLIPDEEKQTMLTKYGILRRNYLKNYKRGIYSGMLLNGELMGHCLEIQEQAEQRLDNLTEKLMKSQGVTEQLKATNPLEWTRKMNMIYQQAEEAILQELVYQ